MLKLIAVLLGGLVSTNADWYTDPKWSFTTYLGDSIALHCNDTFVNVQDREIVKWRAPGGEDIQQGDKYMLTNVGLVRHMTLTVKDIQAEDKGVYLCRVFRNNDLRTKTIRGINLYKPKYRKSIDEYRYNIMIGCIAAAALFVPLVGMCAVYKYRFKTDEDRDHSRNRTKHRKYVHTSSGEAGELPSKMSPQNGEGYPNEAFSTSTNL